MGNKNEKIHDPHFVCDDLDYTSEYEKMARLLCLSLKHKIHTSLFSTFLKRGLYDPRIFLNIRSMIYDSEKCFDFAWENKDLAVVDKFLERKTNRQLGYKIFGSGAYGGVTERMYYIGNKLYIIGCGSIYIYDMTDIFDTQCSFVEEVKELHETTCNKKELAINIARYLYPTDYESMMLTVGGSGNGIVDQKMATIRPDFKLLVDCVDNELKIVNVWSTTVLFNKYVIKRHIRTIVCEEKVRRIIEQGDYLFIIHKSCIKVFQAPTYICLHTFNVYDTVNIEYGIHLPHLICRSRDGHITCWNVVTGQCVALLQDRKYTSKNRICISIDGKYIAISNESKVEIWKNERYIETIQLHGNVDALCFSPDSKYIVISGSNLYLTIKKIRN